MPLSTMRFLQWFTRALILVVALLIASSAAKTRDPSPTPSSTASEATLVPPPAPTPHARNLEPQQVTVISQAKDVADVKDWDARQDLQHIPISKEQLEKLLGLVMDTKFNLEVLEDTKGHEGMDRRPPEYLGRIPVHLKVRELKIGGVTMPRILADSENSKANPINYGNVEE
ncbi:hypothetical protein B0O80DRAFT_293861 [Mortierella sp. GBAus27b]|nr:hypothetical protein B0O80DRAFT_293861 [Mortierella sp. GBAus27b]